MQQNILSVCVRETLCHNENHYFIVEEHVARNNKCSIFTKLAKLYSSSCTKGEGFKGDNGYKTNSIKNKLRVALCSHQFVVNAAWCLGPDLSREHPKISTKNVTRIKQTIVP